MTKQKASGIWRIVIDDEASSFNGRRENMYQTYLRKNVSNAQFHSDLNDSFEEAAIRIVEKDIGGFKTHPDDEDFVNSISNGALFDDALSIMKAKGYSEVDLIEVTKGYFDDSPDVSFIIKEAEKRAGKSGKSKSSKKTKRKKR